MKEDFVKLFNEKSEKKTETLGMVVSIHEGNVLRRKAEEMKLTMTDFIRHYVYLGIKSETKDELPLGFEYEENTEDDNKLIQCRCCGEFLPKHFFHKDRNSFHNSKTSCRHKKETK